MSRPLLWSTFISLAGLTATGPSVLAQTREQYQAFLEASATWDMHALHEMAQRLGASPSGGERTLGLLVLAKIDYREQRLAASMQKLDSILQYHGTGEAELLARAHREKCIINTDLQFLPQAVREADLGLALVDSSTAPGLYAELLVAKAEALSEIPEYNQAHQLLTQAYHLAEKAADKVWMGGALMALGNIQYGQRNYDKAVESYRQAIQVVQDASNQVAVHAISNLAAASAMSGKLDPARQILDSLLTVLGPKDPALQYNCMSILGFISARQGNYAEAVSRYRAALAFADSVGLREGRTKTKQLLATALWNLGDRAQGLALANDALASAQQEKEVATQVELHRRLARWQNILGNDRSAYEHATTYAALSDSLVKARFNQQLIQADILFDTERREHQIERQKQALELAYVADRRKNLQRILLGLTVVAITIIALLLWRSLRRKQKLGEQERQLHIQEVNDLMRRNEINTMQAMLEGQEKERERTAKDLHDRLGAMLSTIKMQVGALESKVEEVQVEQHSLYEKVIHLLDEAVGEVRRIAYGMNSLTLSRFGLAKALEDLCDNVRISGKLAVELKLYGLEQRMDRRVEIVIYRIVQELISNVLKHAEAHEISVSVTREAGRISVMISDDGKGFDPSKASGGIGLDNVRSRAASIGATVHVDSTPGHGTTVSVEGALAE